MFRMRLLKLTTAIAATLYLAAFLALTAMQRQMLFQPNAALATPAQAGLAGVETLRLASDDGQSLVAWFRPPAPGRPLILYFHGNGGRLADRRKRFGLFASSGYGLLAVSYRGYGGSTGEPSEAGLLLDAEAVWAEAARLGFTGRRLVIVGESLGTGVATVMAARHGAAALVLDSPYLSVEQVAGEHFPIFPVKWVLHDAFRSDLAIGDAHMPTFMAHGEEDPVIPIDSARRLYELANGPKEFLAVPGAGHLVLHLPQVYPRVAAFIDAATAAP
jgi:uncharacterized protein